MKRKIFYKLMILMWILHLLIRPVAALEHETGGINILKTNVAGEPLSGARFYVVREATELEILDPDCVKEIMTIGNDQVEMVYESFSSDKNNLNKKVWETETDGFGNAAIYGLPMGTHYLVEAKAPEGYNRISHPIRVSVNRYSHLTSEDGVKDDAGVIIDNTIHIINVRYRVPETGNPDELPLLLAGIGVMASATALWLISRYRG